MVDAQIQFVRNDEGNISGAKHTQNGRSFEVTKLEEEKEISVSNEVLEKYVGKYKLNDQAAMTISIDDGVLFAQLTGQPKFQVFAKSETVFFFKVVKAELHFNLDDNGKVEGITLHEAGQKISLTPVE